MRCIFAIAILFTGSTPFQLRGETDIVVPVTINGQGPFRFLLDTGSSRSAITRATAARLSRRPTGYTTVVTPSGRSLRTLLPIERLSLEGGPTASVVAMITGADDLASGIEGVIGQDVLRPRVYTIDYRRREVVWHDDAPPVNGVRLALEWQQERVVVTLPQKSPARELRLMPDSGTDGWVFFSRPNRPLPARTPLDTVGLRTLSGPRLLRRVLIDRIDVGTFTFRDQLATLIEQRDADGLLEDGLLPLHLFTRVTFNGPQGYLMLSR
jgi:hypothetical protein